MNTFILMIILMSTVTQNDTITYQEFSSYESCTSAKQTVVKLYELQNKQRKEENTMIAQCIEK